MRALGYPWAEIKKLLGQLKRELARPARVRGFDLFCRNRTRRPDHRDMVGGHWAHEERLGSHPGERFQGQRNVGDREREDGQYADPTERV